MWCAGERWGAALALLPQLAPAVTVELRALRDQACESVTCLRARVVRGLAGLCLLWACCVWGSMLGRAPSGGQESQAAHWRVAERQPCS